jgi:hypothetical protein
MLEYQKKAEINAVLWLECIESGDEKGALTIEAIMMREWENERRRLRPAQRPEGEGGLRRQS